MGVFDYRPDVGVKALPVGGFDFLAPPRIVFGWGRRTEIGGLAASLGSRAFVICGSQTLQANGTMGALFALLEKQDVTPLPLAEISHEPLVADVDRATKSLCDHGV